MPEWLSGSPLPPSNDLRAVGFVSGSLSDDEYTRLRLVRRAFVRRFGFSIPCTEAVAAVATLSPIVEVGAGTGYWSRLIALSGADIVATDPDREQYGFRTSSLFPVESVTAERAVILYPRRTLFCSWPTKGERWLELAVERLESGSHLVLIGEDRGGETALPSLFDLLDRMSFVDSLEIPCFPGAYDRLSIYRKTPA